jgi:hypothetical protein
MIVDAGNHVSEGFASCEAEARDLSQIGGIGGKDAVARNECRIAFHFGEFSFFCLSMLRWITAPRNRHRKNPNTERQLLEIRQRRNMPFYPGTETFLTGELVARNLDNRLTEPLANIFLLVLRAL